MPTASNALGEAAGAAARLPCLDGDGLTRRYSRPPVTMSLARPRYFFSYYPFQKQRKPLMPDRQHDSLLDQ